MSPIIQQLEAEKALGVAPGASARPQPGTGVAASPWTPGPWRAETRDYDHTWDILDSDGSPIASVPNPYEHLGDRDDLVEATLGVTEATAKLIAAVPEMYVALHDAAIALNALLEKPEDETRRHHCRHFLERARAALAKAENR